MSERKRRKFSAEEVRLRLSRRRFAMATTGAAMMAFGGRNAWAQEITCDRCDNTAKVFKNLTMAEVFGTPGSGGIELSKILDDAIGSDFPESGIEGERLRAMHKRVVLRDKTQPGDTPICYRDFFVTPGTTTFEQVMDELVKDETIKVALTTDMRAVSNHFHLPMLLLPKGHQPAACKNLIDGWPDSDKVVSGVVDTFGTDRLTSILSNAPDYTDRSKPWRWRAHLLRLTNLFGMTSMTNGAATNYAAYYESHMNRAVKGANQCAYYSTAGAWECQTSSGDKCKLEGTPPEPSEGTDMCSPPPGP